MKSITKFLNILLLAILIFSSGCKDWLVIQPENNLTLDEFWKTQAEVQGVLTSAYKEYRNTLDENINWGELRADELILTGKATDEENKISSLTILPTNTICNWANFYKIISYANAVIAKAPEAQKVDPSYTLADMNAMVAQARFLRSLSYFYIVRTFREAPLVTEPFLTDANPFIKAKSTERDILDFIETDLKTALGEGIPKEYTGAAWQNKGLATELALRALMADVYLWDEKYTECIAACDNIINSGKLTLLGQPFWYNIFYVGNTNESIYELQYDKSLSQTNNLWEIFYNNARYAPSPNFSVPYANGGVYKPEDFRGFINYTFTKDSRLWKYAGKGVSENPTPGIKTAAESDSHWIYYRYSDVLLMKAEALVEKDDRKSAFALIQQVSTRAGVTLLDTEIPDTKLDYENFILAEREREFVGEGKRWFDLLRNARRNNYARKDLLINILLQNVGAKDQTSFRSKLSDPNSYYLPIYYDELQKNKLLTQNPYYLTEQNK